MPRTERERIAAVAALAAICAAALVLPGLPVLVTVPATILLLLLLPGYALTLALFPARMLSHAEQVMFAVGLSVSSAILAGLVLNILPVGLTLSGWGALLGAIAVGSLGVAWLRLGTSDRPLAIVRLPRVPMAPVVMIAVAAVMVLGSLMIARMGEAAQPEDGFTQLWMIPEANGDTVRLGFENHEHSATHYDLRVTAGDQTLADWTALSVADGQSWEQTVVLPALPAGAHQVEAALYRDGDTTPYRQTHVEVADLDATATPKPKSP
jgi:uncharacterized membrane protein